MQDEGNLSSPILTTIKTFRRITILMRFSLNLYFGSVDHYDVDPKLGSVCVRTFALP
jgi:hypothetical protein